MVIFQNISKRIVHYIMVILFLKKIINLFMVLLIYFNEKIFILLIIILYKLSY